MRDSEDREGTKRRREYRKRSRSSSRSRSRSRGSSRRSGSRATRRRNSISPHRRNRSRSKSRSRSGSYDRRRSRREDKPTARQGRWGDKEVTAGATGGIAAGRGRAANLPSWMTHPDGVIPAVPPSAAAANDFRTQNRTIGGLQDGSREGRQWEGGGRGGGGRGGGGRDSANNEEQQLPMPYSILRGQVHKVEHFGAFVALDGYRKHGLVHKSQMVSYHVEDINDIVAQGDKVWVKVLEIQKDPDPRKTKMSLSMKYVNQSDGTDLDASNVEAETELMKRKPRDGIQTKKSVELGAVLNTVCTKCGGHGHLSLECFVRAGQKYDMVVEDDIRGEAAARDDRGGGGGGLIMSGVGRGRGAVLPAWMMEGGPVGGLQEMDMTEHEKRDKKKEKKEKKKEHKREKKEKKEAKKQRKKEKKEAKKKHKKKEKHKEKTSRHHHRIKQDDDDEQEEDRKHHRQKRKKRVRSESVTSESSKGSNSSSGSSRSGNASRSGSGSDDGRER